MNESTGTRKALFGGSFDPVHLGHLGMAEAVQRIIGLDEILFLPCYVSPFKKGSVARADQRLDMLRLALEDCGHPWAGLSTWEIQQDVPSYSWKTAAHYQQSEPSTEWFWILGTDQWNQIEQWAEPDRLRQLLHFTVVTRNGENVLPREGWRHTPVPFEHPASSTLIRQHRDAHADWLTPGVRRYCLQHRLYENGESADQ